MVHTPRLVLLGCALLLVWTSVDRPRAQRTRTPPAPQAGAEPTRLTDSGGRLSWYHGEAHDLIAFDAIVDDRTRDTEVFVMRPDGSGRRCVTCDAETPKGFVGQPVWHPDGEHLIIQVENERSDHRFYNHMSFGIDNDLWIVRRDGTGAERIWETQRHHAALHPQLDGAGTTLIFAERTPTGRQIPLLGRLTPGGENHWAGWQIRVADFDVKARGTDRIRNARAITPNDAGFYETHGFTDSDRRLVYSYTPGQGGFVQNVYTARLDGSDVEAVTTGDGSWDEHGQFSAAGDFAWMSSRFDPSLKFPGTRAANLRSELFVRRADGREVQVTRMNERLGRRVVVSDFEWDREGRRIAFQVAELTGRAHPEIWLVEIE